MAHKLAALWLVVALGSAAPAFADPPAPDGHQWVSAGQNAYIVDLASGEISGAFIGVLTNYEPRD